VLHEAFLFLIEVLYSYFVSLHFCIQLVDIALECIVLSGYFVEFFISYGALIGLGQLFVFFSSESLKNGTLLEVRLHGISLIIEVLVLFLKILSIQILIKVISGIEVLFNLGESMSGLSELFLGFLPLPLSLAEGELLLSLLGLQFSNLGHKVSRFLILF